MESGGIQLAANARIKPPGSHRKTGQEKIPGDQIKLFTHLTHKH